MSNSSSSQYHFYFDYLQTGATPSVTPHASRGGLRHIHVTRHSHQPPSIILTPTHSDIVARPRTASPPPRKHSQSCSRFARHDVRLAYAAASRVCTTNGRSKGVPFVPVRSRSLQSFLCSSHPLQAPTRICTDCTRGALASRLPRMARPTPARRPWCVAGCNAQ